MFDDPAGTLDLSDDLDGYGHGDLVIGAPRDPTVGVDAGSVSIFWGAVL